MIFLEEEYRGFSNSDYNGRENKVFYILSLINGSENKVFYFPSSKKQSVKMKFFIFSPAKKVGK